MKRILLFILSLLFLATAFQSDKILTSGWYQQFMPNLNGQAISDIYFLDSLNGWAVTQSASVTDTAYILKTTNGGDNWIIKYGSIDDYSKVMFVNQNTGFVSGGDLLKSTNSGNNWFSINRPNQTKIEDMYVLNNDTIWIVDNDHLTGGVFRTTNGGLNWTQQFSGGTENPNKIYMYNARIGFITNNTGGLLNIRKTTDGGLNWSILVSNDSFTDIYLIDSLTGWRANNFIKKTTDGGLNWVNQVLPQGINGQAISAGIKSLSVINKDTIWGSYASVIFPNSIWRSILFRTTNGGDNWLYQIPDTTINLGRYLNIRFFNKYSGWAYASGGGIHTTTGGDTLFYTGVTQINTEVPNDYKLFQNYPNPFNPKTTIEYEIKRSGFITLGVYDIRGKEMMTLVSQKQTPGKYLVDFPGVLFPSGVYFYRLSVDEIPINTKKMMLIK